MSSGGFSFFPGLARLQAQADLMRAQAAQAQLEQQKYAAQRQGLGYFGDALLGSVAPGGYPMPPQPGQASVAGQTSVPADYSGFYNPGPAYGSDQLGGLDGASSSIDVGMQGLPNTQPDMAQGATVASGQVSPPAPQGQPPAQAAGQQQGKLSLQQVLAAIKQKHPDADPVAVAEAVNYFLPFLQEQDQHEWQMKNADQKLQTAIMLEEGRNTRADQRLTSQDFRAKLANDTQLLRLQAQQQHYTDLAAQAKRNGDLNAMAEARRQAMALSEQAYQYAASQANAQFINDPDQKQQALDAINADFAQAKQAIMGVSSGGQSSGGTPTPVNPGGGKVLNLKKKVAPASPAGQTYNPETMRLE